LAGRGGIVNYPAYFRQKKAEAACFRNDEHPDYYEDKGVEVIEEEEDE
jgi:hypothetical protein